MSKSLGNFYTLRDLMQAGYQPEAIRYLLASVPYRKKLNFTFDGLKAASTSIERLRNFEHRLKNAKLPSGQDPQLSTRAAGAIRQFEESMDDDLNTAEALAAIFEYIRETNTVLDEDRFPDGNRGDATKVLAAFDLVFDVLRGNEAAGVPAGILAKDETASGLSEADIEALIAERSAAKKGRNFAVADEIRATLLDKGIVIEDTKDGVRWKRK